MPNETGAGSVFSEALPELLADHFHQLTEASGIGIDVIRERGYRSLLGKDELRKLGFSPAQQRAPGILIPLWSVDGKEAGFQFRPDRPRTSSSGKPVKYESPAGSSNRLDCPPRSQKMLGDPQVPLWITEGSKKADAMASKGACAISIAGVWGFKGKNQFGGVTFLSDWDYVALKERVVYLCFDSDVVTKEPVKKALEHLAWHLSRKGARVSVVRLPQQGEKKTGIDDYLLEHSLEDAEKLAHEAGGEEGRIVERSVPGFILEGGAVGEMVVDRDERAFVVVAAGSVRRTLRYQAGRVTYVPTADPLVGQVVHFAATAKPYDSQSLLFAEVKAFIHRYVELQADFEEIAALYVLLTWVYEFAPCIPYLRVIGDWGSGKTRFLDVVGKVCFRPIFASGATTPSPIFRILDKFRGTLVLDEADFKDSSAWVEMVKILNNGYRPNFPVLRADKEGDGRWYPHGYQVFGPKLIATRSPFKDEALESRCLTTEMMPLTRQEIPRVLPPRFETEVLELRAKLLAFRLANLFKLKGRTFGNELLEPNLQPRLQEILIPLKAMLDGDKSMAESLASFIHRLQETLFARRRESPAGRVLAALIELHEEGGELSAKNIADKLGEMDDDAPTLTTQKVGWLTKKLGFEKDKDSSSRRHVIHWDPDRIARQAAIHGLHDLLPLSQENSFESFETFAPDTDSRAKEFPKDSGAGLNSFADSEAKPKETKEPKEFLEDVAESPISKVLGMTLKQVVAIWEGKGKPEVHLGPGEDCFDLKRLLYQRNVNERHLTAVRKWLSGGDDHDSDDNPPRDRGSEGKDDWDSLERELDEFLSEVDTRHG